jgi:amidase
MRHLYLPQIPSAPEDTDKLAVADMMIEDIRSGYDRNVFKVSDVATAVLGRIARFEPVLNAFTAINQRLLQDAQSIDAELSDGLDKGPLHGIPVIIKDSMNEAGVRTTAGYAGFAADDRVVDFTQGVFNGVDLVPTKDASVVVRLRAAGALIIGRSNLPDFALDGLRADSSHNGDTLNPYDARFAPGASSTGSAAAVAAGFGTAGLGTDTAGSILFPASAQCLVGLKPSFGLVPGDGIYPGLSSHHDVAGPITKCVRDSAVLLDVLAGTAVASPHAAALRRGALNGKVIGLFEPGQWAGDPQAAIASHYRRMVGIFESLGARTVSVVFADTDWKAQWDARTFFTTCNAYLAGVDTFLAALGGDNPASRSAFKEKAGFQIGLGTKAPLFGLLANPAINVGLNDPRLAGVIGEAAALRERYESILANKGVDALLMPRSIAPLPDITGDTVTYLGDQVVGTQVNEMGLPAITVPAGFLDDGRPIAVDIVGRARFTEAEILAFAYDFEQATMLRRPPFRV